MFSRYYFPPSYFAPTYFSDALPTPGSGGGYYVARFYPGLYYPPRYYPGTTTTPVAVYPTLLSAAVAQIRGFNSGAIVTALGETSGSKKIYADEAMGSPAPPWVTIEEPQEQLEQQTIGDDGIVYYFGRGSLEITVYGTTKLQVKAIRKQIVTALNDAPLLFADGTLISDHLRLAAPLNSPIPGVTIGAAQGYSATAQFTYFVERTYL